MTQHPSAVPPTTWATLVSGIYEVPSIFDYAGGGYVSEAGLDAIGGKVYMRWGFATLDAADPDAEWEGWGYRKIVAKHGWGPDALQKTIAALQTPPIEAGNPMYDTYLGDDPSQLYSGPTGVLCKWRVVVQREPYEEPKRPESSTGKDLDHIITAHGIPAAQ